MTTPAAPKLPNVSWRQGRPRFTPGEPIRRLGFRAEDLKHADGRWFTQGEALDWSTAKAAEIAASRAALLAAANRKRPKGMPPIRHAPVVYTIERLFEDWQKSPRWIDGVETGKRKQKSYSDNTRRDYRQKMRAIASHDPELYASAVEALDAPILYGLYEDLWETRGLATARGCIATLSSAISWGRKRGRVRLVANPAENLGMQMPDIVVRFAEREEIAALVEAADACGLPEIGDMVTIGVWTGQRQNDRLAMVDHVAGLVKGRRLFRQSKTRAVVAVKQSPELRKRLDAAARRRAKAGLVSDHVVLDERQGVPFLVDHYRHSFARIRAVAVAGLLVGETPAQAIERQAREAAAPLPDDVARMWKLKPCPSLSTFAEKNLRSTAVVWMALAGSTIPEIISVTGHTAASAHTILKHYLASHPEMADSAMAKMIDWFERDDEKAV